MYSLEYSSPKVFNDLCNLGCIPNKTFKLKFPKIRKDLIPHFVRGYFDGDGSVFIKKSKRIKNGEKIEEYNYTLGISFSGTHDFLEEIRIRANMPEKTLYKDNRKSSDCWELKVYYAKRCYELYKYLYNNCGDLFLPRKKEIFDNFFKDRGSTTIIASPSYFEDLD